VTAAAGFKRLGVVIACLLVVGCAALGSLALLIPADKVREATKSEIREVTGLDLLLGGDASVSLFPTGLVSFSNVALGDGSEPALAADRLTARLRFFPLFLGRIEIADIALTRPQLNLAFGADGRSNWSSLLERLARAVGPKNGRAPQESSFSEIRMDQGTILIKDSSRNIVETLERVDLALAWPSISKSFAANGRVHWHGAPVDIAVTLADFAAALAGDRSGIKLRVQGAPLKAVFEGHMSVRPTLKVEGTLAADSTSLRETFRWAGIKPLSGGGFGPFALKAKTTISGAHIALSNVNIELDGNAAEGVLTFAPDGRQTIQGTLAANDLDLTPYISTFRLLTSNEREWNRVPIVLDGLTGVDLDLRLSAAKITLARAKLGRTAVAANLRSGKLTVTIGEAQAFGGILKGAFSLASSDAGADFKSQLQFTDVDLENCFGELFGFRRLEGRGNMTVALEATGGDMLGMTRTLNGTANVVGRQGALVGLNVEQLLRRLERRPLSGTGDFRSGRTPFEKLAIDIKIANGIASVNDVKLEGSKVRLGVAGSASIPNREFDLRGVAALAASTAGDSQQTFELPFIVQGPWEDPIMLPDTQSLLARSPAAAPLLEGVRNRASTRDSVRSAIDRLIGGPAAGTPLPEQQPGR
jgi:AsmA protein